MATLTYRANDKDGLRVCGAFKMQDEKTLESHLAAKGYTNLIIFKSNTRFSNSNYKLVSPRELSIFCRQMSVLFYSHITLMEGLLLLEEQSENKNLRTALKEIYSHMEQGYTFAESIGMYTHMFGSYLLNMITIGETSGTLDTTFQRMTDYFDKESKMRKKLRSAVAYPAILTILMTAIVLFLILRILPMFNDILNSLGKDIPGVTKIILSVSSFVSSYLWIILGIILIAAGALYAYFRTENGRMTLDGIKMKLPFSKFIIARIITARFASSLSILLKSGVQLINSLEEIKTLVDNKRIEKKYENAISDVKNGGDLAEALSKVDVFPPLFLKMVIIGQTTGHLDDMLEKSASVFDNDVDEAVERFTVMIEPILIIILSVIVGIILVSVMIPMISIMNNIG